MISPACVPMPRSILEDAVGLLGRNPETTILITGNADIRGKENYNLKLGKARAEQVKSFMLDNGIAESRIKIVSRGKLDAVAPITDLVGMQKDRNAQFMIAEVEEIMIPAPGAAADALHLQNRLSLFLKARRRWKRANISLKLRKMSKAPSKYRPKNTW